MAGQDSVHFGPISSGSPDSGTCGLDWDNDTYMRVFDAGTTPNADGTYNVTENFIAGRFVTVAGPARAPVNQPEPLAARSWPESPGPSTATSRSSCPVDISIRAPPAIRAVTPPSDSCTRSTERERRVT